MSVLAIVQKVQTITQTKLNAYLTAAGLPTVLTGNVRKGSIDPLVNANLAVWIQADKTTFEEHSIDEDEALTIIKVFLIVRGAVDATLWENLYKTAAYFREMIGDNMTLEGVAQNAMVIAFEFFENVEAAPGARAVEISLEVSHEEARG